MIRLITLASILVAVVAFMVTTLPAPVQAQAETAAQDLCLARWAWNTDDVPDGEPYWEPPHQDVGNALGVLDFRSILDKGAGPVATGWGLFSYDAPMGSTGMHCLGANLDTPKTVAQINTLATLLGVPPGQLRSRNMRNVIVELYQDHGDPTGLTRWKPMQSTRGGLVINLGGYSQIYGEPFSAGNRAFQNTLDIRWADYRRAKAEGAKLKDLRRQTGFDSFRIFGRAPTKADLDKLLPPEHRKDGYSCHKIELCTTITESFNTADSDTLGPDLTWTELSGTDIDVVSNRANSESSSGYARASTALAGSDMYAQALVTNTVSGTDRGASGCVRYAAAADTAYFGMGSRSGSGTYSSYAISIRTAGVNSFTAETGGYSDAIPGVIQTEVVGSTINVYYAGALRTTLSDSSITGNTQAGICGRHTGGDRLQWDDFEAADLAVAARRIIRIN